MMNMGLFDTSVDTIAIEVLQEHLIDLQSDSTLLLQCKKVPSIFLIFTEIKNKTEIKYKIKSV